MPQIFAICNAVVVVVLARCHVCLRRVGLRRKEVKTNFYTTLYIERKEIVKLPEQAGRQAIIIVCSASSAIGGVVPGLPHGMVLNSL